jgi:hypothetical protein
MMSSERDLLTTPSVSFRASKSSVDNYLRDTVSAFALLLSGAQVFDMNSQQQRISPSPRYQFFRRCDIDFFIAAQSIFSSPRSQFFHRRAVDFFIAAQSIFHRREADFFIAAQSIFSSPQSRFFHCRAVDFFIAAKLIFSSLRSQFFHRRKVVLFIAAISIFLCLTARIDFIPPDGNSRLTAISISSLPHGKNRFHALWQFTPHGNINFFFASRKELISSA